MRRSDGRRGVAGAGSDASGHGVGRLHGKPPDRIAGSERRRAARVHGPCALDELGDHSLRASVRRQGGVAGLREHDELASGEPRRHGLCLFVRDLQVVLAAEDEGRGGRVGEPRAGGRRGLLRGRPRRAEVAGRADAQECRPRIAGEWRERARRAGLAAPGGTAPRAPPAWRSHSTGRAIRRSRRPRSARWRRTPDRPSRRTQGTSVWAAIRSSGAGSPARSEAAAAATSPW